MKFHRQQTIRKILASMLIRLNHFIFNIFIKSRNNSNLCFQDRRRSRKQPTPKKRMTATEEIEHLQATIKQVIPRAPFNRLVRDIGREIDPDLRFAVKALDAIHEASEMFMVQLFEDTLLCAIHAHRQTIKVQDMKLVELLHGIQSSKPE